MTNRKIEYWVIPPKTDAEFAAGMEDVLETYEKPYDPHCPVLCMDEQPVQLLKETRTPIPATEEHGRRVDYEYERAGTANVFMFTEPLAGWREVAVRETKTKTDWAVEMARLLGTLRTLREGDSRQRQLEHAHEGGVLRSVAPEHARQLVRRIEFHHTPKPGSWLNIAENELSSLTRQCVSGGLRRHQRAAGGIRLVNRRKLQPTRRRLANENRRRPLQTEIRSTPKSRRDKALGIVASFAA